MTPRLDPSARPLWALPLMGTYALHVAHKVEHDLLQEMLWACHVASLSIGLGMLTYRTALVAIGTLFHLAVGVPSFVLDLVVLRTTTVTSFLIHTVPLATGLAVLRCDSSWPRWTPLATGSLYIVLIPISRWLTAPELNVNLAFRPWAPLVGLISPWLSWLASVAGLALVLPVANRWLRCWSRCGTESQPHD